MKLLKPIVATAIAAGLVSSAVAGYPTHHAASKHAAKASHAASSSWTDRIALGASARFAYFNENKDAGVDTSSFDMNDVHVDVNANINSSTKAHVGLLSEGGDLSVEEAYATFSGIMGTSVDMTAGKKYTAFTHGSDHTTKLPTLAQDLSQSIEDVVEFNVENSGVKAGAYIFKDVQGEDSNDDINKFGFDVSTSGQMDAYKYSVGFDYINDVRTVADSHTTGFQVELLSGRTADKEGAYDFHFDVCNGAFNFGVNYLQYSKAAITVDAVDAVADDPETEANETVEAADAYKDADSKAKVTGFDLGYKMDTAGYKAHFGVSYEEAKNAASVLAWKERLGVNYDVELSKHVTAGLGYAKLKAFRADSDQNDLFATVRVSV